MADPRFHENKGPFRLDDIADIGKCNLDDVYNHIEIDDVASLSLAHQGQLTFLDNVKYKDQLSNTKATACILHPKMIDLAPKELITLISENP